MTPHTRPTFHGSHQSLNRDWAAPMHRTDNLFHKKKVEMGLMFGGEADDHANNTVPKETLVGITRANDGGSTARVSGSRPGPEKHRAARTPS